MSFNLSSYSECSKLRQEVRVVIERLDLHNYLKGKCPLKIESGTGSENIGLIGAQNSGFNIEDVEFSQDSWSHDEENTDEHTTAGVKFEPEESNDDDGNDESSSSGSNTGNTKRKRTTTRKQGSISNIQCLICKEFYSCRGNLLRHHKRQHRKIPLPTVPTRESPVQKSSDPENPYRCQYCSKVFKFAYSLKLHVRIHRPPGMKMYECKFCGKEFIHRTSLSKHVLQHSNDKPHSCSKCGFTSKYRSSIYHHEKTCYNFRVQDEMAKKNRQLFHCDLCGKPFTSEVGVYNHKVVTEGNCKVFACSICGKKFYRETLFREHETLAHSEEYPFPCPICDNKFKMKKNLQAHMRSAHTQRWVCPRLGCTSETFPNQPTWRRHVRECDKPIVCSSCEQSFDSKEAFAAHTHPIECEKCDKTYGKKSQMDLHLLYHDPLNIHKCEGCTFGFSSFGEFTTHKKMSHRNVNRMLENYTVRSAENIYYFTCKYCEAEFEDPSSTQLVDHVKSTHTDKIGQFICPTCGRGFNTVFKCFSHRNKRHGPVQTDFKCEACVLYFQTKHGLHVHNTKCHYEIPLVDVALTLAETMEDSEPPEGSITLGKFSCLFCGKKCMDKSGVKRHMTLHRMDKEYKCDLCVRSWSGSEGLDKHNRVFHSDLQLEPVLPKIFECNFCDKVFSNKNNLTSHTRIHTKEKPYACDICDKRFTTSESRILHMLVHSGERPRSCDFCGESFARNNELHVHIKRYHKIDA